MFKEYIPFTMLFHPTLIMNIHLILLNYYY